MPKATLQFKLPDEEKDHLCAVHGRKLVTVIWDVLQEYRKVIKYSSAENEHFINGVLHAQRLLLEHLDSAGLSNLIFEDI